MKYYLAVDIGASSGRHILGWIENGVIKTEEVYRFENGFAPKGDNLCWDIDALEGHIIAGMVKCSDIGRVPSSVGIDTWGVDYVLLDKSGKRMGNAIAYRDNRTVDIDKELEKVISFKELYDITGIQKQQFNTVYQLFAQNRADESVLQNADSFLMIPDYLHYILTGKKSNEYTNATTGALVDARTKTWSSEVLEKLSIPKHIFNELSVPGTKLGTLSKEVENKVGFNCDVVLPATHDTGSAYLAVPAKDENSVYISSGTWSLLGVESKEPIISQAAFEANFTNEGGYAYRYRFLKNIMGLWMIQSVRRDLNKKYSYAQLEEMAKQSIGFKSIVDVNAAEFLAPANMIEAVKKRCAADNQPVPETVGEVMQCIYISLADCYCKEIKNLEHITGREFTSVNIVGGGTKDVYLNQLTANATGLPVFAGPTEGTVIGNLIVQMISGGELENLTNARKAVENSFEIIQFIPQ